MVIKPWIDEFFSEIVDNIVILIRLKCLIFKCFAFHGCRFGRHTLNQHSNCHSRRKSIWVDDDIRGHSGLRKWHIYFRPQHRKNTFLTVPWWKFVSDNRFPIKPQFNWYFFGVVIFSTWDNNSLNAAGFRLLVIESFKLFFGCLVKDKNWNKFPQPITHLNQSVIIEALGHLEHFFWVWRSIFEQFELGRFL